MTKTDAEIGKLLWDAEALAGDLLTTNRAGGALVRELIDVIVAQQKATKAPVPEDLPGMSEIEQAAYSRIRNLWDEDESPAWPIVEDHFQHFVALRRSGGEEVSLICGWALDDAIALCRSEARTDGGEGDRPGYGRVAARLVEIQAALPVRRAGLTDGDVQELVRLREQNVVGEARDVVERDPERWERVLRLSDLGLVAIEQVALGGRLHITRRGIRTLDAVFADLRRDAA